MLPEYRIDNMIEISKSGDRIFIEGHAEYAEPGKDIVCAAISMLPQVVAVSVEALAAAKIKTAQIGG